MADAKKIIFDTDLGGDCDDVGAAAVLCNLARAGEAKIVAATYCIGNPWGGWFLKYELDFFGFGDVPVGVLKDEGFMWEPNYAKYSRPYCERMNIATPEMDDAVRVLRRALAENGGVRDITLVAVGPLRNIANLLASEPDDISPLTGYELIEQNVSEFVTMLGNFTSADAVEWNVLMDIPSARRCVADMPTTVVFSPWEAGGHIITGQRLGEVPEDHPVRAAYTLYADGKHHTRMSWDLVTVYCAVRDTTPLYRREPLHVTVNERGVTLPEDGADMLRLVQCATDDEIVDALNALML
ncbi:MAG: nucleoside hydrolase [Clostridia bacterium]|nr:nucleoside hydrolase [Clostridia bacterium]